MKREDLIAYEYDASNIKGLAKAVFLPKSINELSRIVNQEKRICIRGGGSGLSGGAVPQQNLDIVLDLSKINKIDSIDSNRQTIELEAGVIHEELQEYLKKFNLEFPINPQSSSICTIGGMIATNAVDSRAIKYKNTEKWVRWIEIMDSDGKIQRKGKTEISDYCGMEGITGIIVKACLNLTRIKKRTATLIKIENKEKIMEILNYLKKETDISMIDFIDKKISYELKLPEAYHLIIEYENDSGILKDKEYEDLINKKELIYKLMIEEGHSRIEDPKIITDKFLVFLEWFENKKIPLFAHLSIGILQPFFFKAQEEHIPEMMKLVKRYGGKISGKNGIGIIKKEYLDPNDKKIIINIKKRTDKLNKFNIGKVI